MAGRTKAQRSRQHNPVDTAGSGASWSPHELVELAHEAVLVRDADGGTIRFWNRGAEALYGWSRQEAIGQVSHVLLRTQFPMPLAEIEAQLRATGYWEGELTHTTRDGRRLVVASRWILRRDPAGQGAAFLEFNTDITLRKDAEARAELATLVEAADDAIVRVSVDGTITSWNPGGERLYGYSAAEAVGQPISLLAPADRPDEPAALLTRVRQDSAIKTWGRDLAKRMGFKHAAVAVARKLAVVLHAMWRRNAPFQAWPATGAANSPKRV